MRDAIATAGDDDLIQRSLAEPECFAALFDRHAPHLHAYVARRLGPDVADDVVSDTFLDAFRRRHVYFRDHTDARPWLYRDRLQPDRQAPPPRDRPATPRLRPQRPRRDDRRPRGGGRDDPGREPAAAARALAALKPGDRDVLLLVAWAQFTYGEVALALSIPVGTVRSRA